MRGLVDRFSIWPGWAQVVALLVALVVVVSAAAGGTVLALRSGARLPAISRTAASPTPGAPSPGATPGGRTSPRPSTVAVVASLKCRIAISSGQPGSGGFVTFPGAIFAADPSSNVQSAFGYGLMFDRAFSRWLPVPRSWVSPDGTRYVYWDPRAGSLEAVSLNSSGLTALGPKPGGAASAARVSSALWQPVEALEAGVYAIAAGPPSPGLWLFPWSGSGEQQVIGTGFWHAIGGSAAYGTASQSVPQGAENTILRLTLAGGSPVEWFSRPGLQSRVVGFDVAGNAVVEAGSPGATEVWLVTGPRAGTKLLTIPQPQPGQSGGQSRAALMSVVGDANGIWLATTDGLYFAGPTGTEKASSVTGLLGAGCFQEP